MAHQGKPIVLVTGCSSGIGRETVGKLVERGFGVVAGVRQNADVDQLNGLSESIVAIQVDVTNTESIDAAARKTAERFPGGIDGLVNNAGIAVAGPLELVALDDWQRQYQVNVLGMVGMTKRFLPMLRQRMGRIVNISSAASSLALPMVGPYASSKFAVEGLSDSLRRELLGSGIKVVIVCPGPTDTPIYAKAEAETAETLDMQATSSLHYEIPLGRFQALMQASEGRRRHPSHVATTVVKALTARHPKRRYHVGWDAKAAVFVQRCVPTALVDWAIHRKLRS